MIVVLILVVLLIPVQDSSLSCLAQIDTDNLSYLSEKGLLAKKGCQDRCGDVWIPYPFGIRSLDHDHDHDPCYYDKWYEITCNASTNTPRLFYSHFNDLEVMAIDLWELELLVKAKAQNVCSNDGVAVSIDLKGSPYRYSTSNVFTAWGYDGIVVKDRNGNPLTFCAPINLVTISPDIKKLIGNSSLSCDHEIGCCQTQIDGKRIGDVDYYEINILNYDLAHGCNTTAIYLYNHITRGYLNYYIIGDNPFYNSTILKWYPPKEPLDNKDHANFSCNSEDHSCRCEDPYYGNPYLPYGCQVDCYVNGWDHHCRRHHLLKLAIILGLSIGIGSILLLFFVYWFSKFVIRTIEMKQKSKNFKRNGGLLLQQQISTNEGVVNKTKIFALIELNRATDNFNENRILGQGGQGTVYKGMMEDGKIVAIKKSIKVDEDQLEQFINEVVIVSQINHRNVVKLMGCCLETEVPLLVYEFIANGTLYHHFHDSTEDFQLTWKMRLQIAADSACALAYLHSSTSPPIYHRDIKSSNILLDDKYRAKVSDFGTSKVITIEQTHVTTCVQGTYGYLDPEYFQSNQYTEKSDVYSFGVVLVEMITSKKPICPIKTGGWINLASEFVSHMESGTLNDILDPQLLEDGKKEEMVAVAELARRCLKMNGRFRPTMKEVAKMLDDVRVPSQQNIIQHNYRETNRASPDNMNEMCYMYQNIEDLNQFSVEVQPLRLNTF